MAGHSKWANIKHQKKREDKKRGKLFTKLSREIETAAREGGGDPEFNFTLRMAIDKAKDANMPKENIETAIKRGTGELEPEGLEEMWYEGYGPGGAAMMIKCLTNNKNRTVGDLRAELRKRDGSLGEHGSVAWQFDEKGVIVVNGDGHDLEELMLFAIDAGAEDISRDGNLVEIITDRTDLQQVREAFDEKEDVYHVETAELRMIPKTTIEIDPDAQASVARLLDALDDLDDVQNVFLNVEIDEDVWEQIAA